MRTIDVLRQARNLISNPENWTRGTYARNELTDEVLADDPGAVRWCALGAIQRVTSNTGATDAIFALGMEPFTIVAINDDDGHAAILRVFDNAIARLEEFEEGAPIEEKSTYLATAVSAVAGPSERRENEHLGVVGRAR